LALTDKYVGAFLVKQDDPTRMDELEWLVTLKRIPLMNGIMKNKRADYEKILNDFNKGLSIIKGKGIVADILNEAGF
jgi:hypothetical protein